MCAFVDRAYRQTVRVQGHRQRTPTTTATNSKRERWQEGKEYSDIILDKGLDNRTYVPHMYIRPMWYSFAVQNFGNLQVPPAVGPVQVLGVFSQSGSSNRHFDEKLQSRNAHETLTMVSNIVKQQQKNMNLITFFIFYFEGRL